MKKKTKPAPASTSNGPTTKNNSEPHNKRARLWRSVRSK